MQTATEGDAAFFDIRARDVQFECGNALRIGQDPRQLDVLVEGAAADIDDDCRTEAA